MGKDLLNLNLYASFVPPLNHVNVPVLVHSNTKWYDCCLLMVSISEGNLLYMVPVHVSLFVSSIIIYSHGHS